MGKPGSKVGALSLTPRDEGEGFVQPKLPVDGRLSHQFRIVADQDQLAAIGCERQ
jgi:hypothetical protein